MSVSVILPNYNHARWLPRALSALVTQSSPPGELIVIDDASTDDSVAIIERFRAQYPFIRLIRHEKNLGAELAVKNGLAQCTGEFILFAAADDFVLPGLFAAAVPALRQHADAAFFCSEVALTDEHDAIIGFRPVTLPRTTAGYMSPSEVRAAIRDSDNWFVGTSVIYRHSHLKAIGYFDRSLRTLQDALATRLLAFRHGFYFQPDVLSTWRVIRGSLSVQSSLSLADNLALLELADDWIEAHFPADVKTQYVERFNARLRFNMARSRLVWSGGRVDEDAIAAILQWGPFKRRLLAIAARLPGLAPTAVLALMTIVEWPYSLRAMIASLWRNVTVNRMRRTALKRVIDSHQVSARGREQTQRSS